LETEEEMSSLIEREKKKTDDLARDEKSRPIIPGAA